MNRVICISFIFLLICVCIPPLHAQRQKNIWCFGYRAKIDFNSGTPVASDDSQMDAFEGCASISTDDGRLLLYTDGRSVWDSLNQIFVSGLLGDESTTQTFIIPRPGFSSNYYIITVDLEGGTNGLRYTEVDMSLNKGLGGVTANKNIPLRYMACEKMAVVKHLNGIDYWLITHDIPGKNMWTFKISKEGISYYSLSSIGVDVPFGIKYIDTGALGYMKVSNKSNKIAMAHTMLNIVEIMDFNNSTGQLNNVLHINNLNKKNDTYGVEFSPDDRYLYVSEIIEHHSDSSYVHQFDLQAGSESEINKSKVTIARIPKVSNPGGENSFGALQLGPDQKIYVAKYKSEYLGVIQEPNLKGTACKYMDQGIYLNGKLATYGLPVFIHDTFDPDLIYLTFPNIFTPNEDGINDLFRFITAENVKSCEWNIYNRWGNLLFQTKDMQNGWDGKHNNIDCPDGTYYWITNYTSFSGKNYSNKGYLQLKRK
jgi:gliding motility-associated-like protein